MAQAGPEKAGRQRELRAKRRRRRKSHGHKMKFLLALVNDVGTSLHSVRMSLPPAKYFPVWRYFDAFLICNQGRARQRGECILSRWYWNNARQIEKDVGRGFISIPPIPVPSLFAHSRLLMMFTRNNKACNVNQVFCVIVLLVKRSAIEKGTEAGSD